MGHETLVLTRSDVRALLSYDECIAGVENAFRLHAEGRSLPPGVLGVRAASGGFHIKAAGLPLSRPYFAVKTNANFPGNPKRHGLPTIQGVIVVCDAEDGRPLAVMDSMEVTTRRTAAATAVAARYLARSDARTATICGCGVQGQAQLVALTRVSKIERVYAFDVDAETTARYARDVTADLDIEVEPVTSLAEAVRRSDICVTCTPSREVLVRREDVQPGTFVAGVGADAAEKQELDPALMAASVVVVDILDQCAAIGDLHHALAAGVMTRDAVHAELADVVAGRRPGRRSEYEITVFDSTGTALQDVAAAAIVYEKALAAGAGLAVGLGD